MKSSRIPVAVCLGLLMFVPRSSAPSHAPDPGLAEALSFGSVEPSGCAINLKARYDTPLVELSTNAGDEAIIPHEIVSLIIDLKRSQVRTRNGWWASLKPRCGGLSKAVTNPGTREVSMACTLDFSCSRERRYRFLVCRDVNYQPNGCWEPYSNWKYHPGPNGWTRRTTIDLGDLGAMFPEFQMPVSEEGAPGKDAKTGKSSKTSKKKQEEVKLGLADRREG